MIPTVCEVLQLTHEDRNDHDHFAACLQLCLCSVGLVCQAVDLDVIVQGASAHAISVRVLHCSDYVHSHVRCAGSFLHCKKVPTPFQVYAWHIL